MKTFTAEELAHFRKPFEMGWKREVVLRGTVTSSGKKIGDVYYFSPDKKTKLRSYVEMGLYCESSLFNGSERKLKFVLFSEKKWFSSSARKLHIRPTAHIPTPGRDCSSRYAERRRTTSGAALADHRLGAIHSRKTH